jgi:hypothetical protein
MKTMLGIRFFAIAALGLTVTRVSASDITYHFDTVFLNAPAPAGPAPWVDATFHDVSPGTVLLTISAVNLDSGFFIGGQSQGGLFFNLNPGLVPTDLSFNRVSANGSFGDVVFAGANGFKADGDGYYDVNVNFTSHNFVSGSSISFQITDINDSALNASDFSYVSAPGGGAGEYYAAAHIQGGISTWVGSVAVEPVPEPWTGTLLAASFGLWGAMRYRPQIVARN